MAYKQTWLSLYNVPLPDCPASFKQYTWDKPGVQHDIASIWDSQTDDVHRARLTAAAAPHSGDWLHALPISSCGLKLDNETVRIAVVLRLGIELCVPHACPCGTMVDALGIHGLSCRLVCGRMARHQILNDLIWRAFSKASIPACKEPSGLLRTDGKQPDGLSLIPWQAGKAVTWDVTVINTLAASYASASLNPGGAAELAAERKSLKYSVLANSYLFQPLAFETLGPINTSGIAFISELGRRIRLISGDPRESSFLFQRLSLAVQRFNSIAFRGTFATLCETDD